jgi:drug/metabolite transporter (DMT)-like permease
MNGDKSSKGVVALVFLSFGFGLIAITVRYLSGYFTLFQQLYLTIGLAFVFSLFIFPRTLSLKRLKQIPIKDWIIIFLRTLAGYTLGTSLYRESLNLAKIANVAFVQSIPFAGLFGWILLKEKFTWKKLTLLMLAYLGVIIISVNNSSSILTIGKGELIAFISSALFGLNYVMRKWQTNFLNDKELTQILIFLGAIIFFILSLISGEKLPVISLQWLLIVSLVTTALLNVSNVFLISYGFKNVKAVLASNILTLESIFALILAFIFYHEFPTIKELFGGIIIIASVIQMNRLKD